MENPQRKKGSGGPRPGAGQPKKAAPKVSLGIGRVAADVAALVDAAIDGAAAPTRVQFVEAAIRAYVHNNNAPT